MTPQAALDALRQKAQPGRDQDMRAYHKIDRPYLGVANPDTNDLVKAWRAVLDVDERVQLAEPSRFNSRKLRRLIFPVAVTGMCEICSNDLGTMWAAT